MATSKHHYQQVLSPVYSWMHGGHANAVARNRAFFAAHAVRPAGSKLAIDLGAGSGFQSIPLAELGFNVTAIDIDAELLGELKAHAGSLPITPVEDDLCSFRRHCQEGAELVVCMTDTILHLDSTQSVAMLCKDIATTLEPRGRCILTFRDLSHELRELDRFIPVRCDAHTIFTCYLEYETDTVKVHDLVYTQQEQGWDFKKSFYRKLRLRPDWVAEQLREAGLIDLQSKAERGLVTIVASKA